jgi:ubiquinone/menaquinone biosynthesis C-methylase UbiE
MELTARAAYDVWHKRMHTTTADANPLRFPWYRSAFSAIAERPSGDLLEVGCGCGEFAAWLAGAVPALRITGVDFSPAAIEAAANRASDAKRPLQFLTADAQCLSFAGNSFDWIVSCECLEHVRNPGRMAAEIFRVLKPGGRFCITTENYLNGMLIAWLHAWLTDRAFDSGSGIQPIENFFIFHKVRRYLCDAGLVIDATESSHYQWLLLPGVDPARLCTAYFKPAWARRMAKPFGRHFSFFGHKP